MPMPPIQLHNSAAASEFFRNLIKEYGQSDREQFIIALLSSKNRVTGFNIASIGSLAAATIVGREVLKPAILGNACSVVFCHNHPSGDCTPSEEDKAMTRMLLASAGSIGVTVHDHIIVSVMDSAFFSFADKGLLRSYQDQVRKIWYNN